MLLACLLGSSCTQPQPAGNPTPARRAQADWMDLHHPGPYATVTPPGGQPERCQSCHQFETLSTIPSFLPAELQDDPAGEYSDPTEPLQVGGTHPGGWLDWHDPGIVGCVGCHGGNPQGLSYNEAGHSSMFDNNDELDGAPVNVLREASCGRCHAGELVPAAPLLSEGRSLMRELRCSACHSLPDWLSAGYAGPDLGRVGEKYSAGMIALVPMHVQQFKPGSRMPTFDLPEAEAAHIASFLAGDSDMLEDDNKSTVDPADPQALALLAESRCVNCHVLPALPEGLDIASLPEEVRLLWEMPQGMLGPSLELVGRRLSAAWIADFLLNTHERNAGSRMPQLELDAQQAQLLADWLVSASKDSGTPLPALPDVSAGYPVEGNSLFIGRGCAGCHSIDGRSLAGNPVGPSLAGVGERTLEQIQTKAPTIDRLYDYLDGNMRDPQSVGNQYMPRFNLTDGERLAIVTALLAEPQDDSHRMAPLRETPASDPAAIRTDWQAYWQYPVEPQGSGDHMLSRLERDLRPESCAVCHRQQYTQWQGTRHSLAMGPGIVGQIVDMDSANYSSCLKCHAVLSEQQHVRKLDGKWQDNPDYKEQLYLSGNSCASCHVRAHTRFSAVDTFQRYPWADGAVSAHSLERSPLLQSSDFCWNCHQFDESRTLADGGPPLQNTNIEHREWQQRSGDTRSCQACHMPEGAHTFLGIHNEQYVRDSLKLSESLVLENNTGLSARLTIDTSEIGHHFPTYVTPVAIIEFELYDGDGKLLEGSQQEQRIGRDSRTRAKEGGGREWYDESDTRIPGGTVRDFDFPIDMGAFPTAASARLLLRVEPDHFYHNSYKRWIEDEKRSEAGRELLRQALDETSRESSGYTVYEADLMISPLLD